MPTGSSGIGWDKTACRNCFGPKGQKIQAQGNGRTYAVVALGL